MRSILVLENIRSAYNVGNLIRTADALGREVILSGYTPHPDQDDKVKKTSLGAESMVVREHLRNPREAISRLKDASYLLIAGEKTETSISLENISAEHLRLTDSQGIALVIGNEKTGVLPETVASVDLVLHIPMQGMKESLNVGQAGAILMWEINRWL